MSDTSVVSLTHVYGHKMVYEMVASKSLARWWGKSPGPSQILVNAFGNEAGVLTWPPGHGRRGAQRPSNGT